MPSLQQIETFLGFKLAAVISALVGGLLNHFWTKFRARRVVLSWTANFQRLSPQGAEPIFSKIQVLLDSKSCQNLYSCNIVVRNDSSQDTDEFDLLFSFQQSFVILYGQGNIQSSAKNLLLSENFRHTVEVIQKLPESDRAKHASYTYVTQHREFRLPSLNRETSASFTFLVNADVPGENPTVRVTMDKKGIKLVSRPALPRLWDVSLVHAVIWGVVTAVISVFLVSRLSLPPTATAFICFGIGASTTIFGVLVGRVVRLLKRLL